MSRVREVVILEITYATAFVLDCEASALSDAMGRASENAAALGLMEGAKVTGGRVLAIQSEAGHTWDGELPTVVERAGTVYRQGGEDA